MAKAVADEALLEAGLTGQHGFPGLLFLATPPAELEWPQRKALFEHQGASGSGYDRLLAAARTGAFKQLFESFQFASVAEHLAKALRPRGPAASGTNSASSTPRPLPVIGNPQRPSVGAQSRIV